jgi:photosystem II stability/assembly factor-like uncharacterized protein
MKRLFAAVLALAFAALPLFSSAVPAPSPAAQLMSKLHWRSIGPFIGGRVVAVAGVPSDPDLFYMGGVEGGIWKSTDYGMHWANISDGKIPGIADPIGALTVAPSNPRVIYAGTGEADIRGDFDTGDGIYRSGDAGKTWSYAGLRETHMTTALAIDPRDPNVVYASSMGHVFKPNPDRGLFKTTDGGKTWTKVLYVDAKTGCVDVVMDPHHPQTLYAAMWQAQRTAWNLTSGGPGSGLYKTADGGAHWTEISSHPGFARGLLGKMGVAVSASNPRIVYAIVQAEHGGVFRSDDAGATWRRVNREMKLRQRAFYYMGIYVDPKNPNVAYAPQVDGDYKTTDGGKTWKALRPPHGDDHIIWINPNHTNILLEGDDGGATVSVNGGKTWSSDHNQPTGQFYHVALDGQFPFNVYGAQQDEGAYGGPSASVGGSIPLGAWRTVALGESTFVAPQPGDPHVTYGSGYYSAFERVDDITGEQENVSPWPRYLTGSSSAQNKYRFGWTHPIFFSPANPRELLVAAQVVFSSTDQGATWKILSPDLTRNVKSTEGPSGGPINLDQTGAEIFPDISSLAVSPLDANLLWAGSADGLVHVSTDHGAQWRLVTPPALPQWAQISSIEPSRTAKGTAYLTASRYMWDDYHPYLYKTSDYGAHWTTLTNGLPDDQYVFVVREDPRQPRLLFAGTRSTVYVSLDGGANWQALTLNLPGVQVRDLAINERQGDLVAATHGRSFWILDNISLLEQLASQQSYGVASAQLFTPQASWLSHDYGTGRSRDEGENPAYGASVFFSLPHDYDGKTPVTLTFLNSSGATVRSFTLHLKAKHPQKITPAMRERLDATQLEALQLQESTGVEPGMNVFQWDLQYPPVSEVPGFRPVFDDDFPDSGEGPTIVPGAYRVVLQYGGTRLSAPLQVQLDPRLHPGAGALAARFALEMQIHDTMNGLDRAITAAMAARGRLSAAARTALDREIAQLVMLKVHSSEADVLYMPEIRGQLGFLSNSLEGAYTRPTAADYTTYATLRAAAQAGEARLRALTAP